MLEKSLRAIPLVAASLFCSTTLFGFAYSGPFLGQGGQSNQPNENPDLLLDLENKVAQLEEQKANGIKGVVQPFRPPVSHEVGLILEGDALFWKAEQEGLEYAVEGSDPFGTGMMNHGKLLTHDFDWNGGFRVGLGYHLPYDRWDLKGLWTRYTNSSTTHKHTSDPRLSPTFFLFPTLAWFATHAKTHYSIDYNTVDLTLQRDYFVSRSLTLRPIFGIRGAWINQHMRDEFHGGPGSLGNFGSETGVQSVKITNNFRAGGIFAGINMNFCFNRHWSIYGDLAGSILYGQFQVRVKNSISGLSLLGFGSRSNVNESANNVKTNLQTGMGLQWQSTICHDRFRLLFAVGYEILFWFNQNNSQRFVFPGVFNNGYYEANGSLTLQGGTFKAGFEF
jgi:hypothetical protein